MDDKQIQDIADKVIDALQHLGPSEPSGWSIVASLAPVAALVAAGLVTWIGWRNLKHQQRALKVAVRSDARNLRQKRDADARSEWWKRTQWALEAAASDDPRMYSYGTGGLTLLAQSDLAGPKDKALLDAVWEGTDSEMQDAGIEHLIKTASEQEDLSYEELLSLMSFGPSDVEALERLKEQAKNLSVEDMEKILESYVAATDAQDYAVNAGDEAEPPESVSWFRRLLGRYRKSSSTTHVDDSATSHNNVKYSKEEEDAHHSEGVQPEA
ncbi:MULTISPECIES: hypothetical protein [unclassified Arthrobacter]|uniref:hypothetical protein n=1 Tax=unclassified Arthrobacter TaxID=235627 RepID=UPI0028830923|nr:MULTISPECIES: hypothetical protein [unclassified Arthrobacter]